jgi:type I restriction enzyme, S subunit
VYKDSGVPGLGQVPAHWKVVRLKWVASLNPSRTEARASLLPGTPVTFLPMERVGTDGRFDPGEAQPASAVWNGFTYFRRGDVLVAKITPCFENGKGACLNSLPTEFGFGSTEFHILRATTSVSPPFLYRLSSASEFRRLGADTMTGAAGQQRVPESFVANFPVALPPPSEQSAIVRLLDHADRQIRRYIRAKQKLIRLLEEQKQAIIHRAVTRGLDPNVHLQPSGVEWLGDVPAHWEVKRLHQITDPNRPVMYGIVLPGPNVDEGVYIVKGGNCEPGSLRAERLSRTTIEIESRYARSRLVAQDIVFAIRGGVGAAEMVPPELTGANLTQDAARIAAGTRVNPQWLLHAVRAPIFREHVLSRVVGATVRGINIRDLKRIQIVVPPTGEQAGIAHHLKEATGSTVAALDRAHREILLLREYRTRLVADVVIGRLDVRGAAVRLPDAVEEAEPLDDMEALIEGTVEGAGEHPDLAPTEADV